MEYRIIERCGEFSKDNFIELYENSFKEYYKDRLKEFSKQSFTGFHNGCFVNYSGKSVMVIPQCQIIPRKESVKIEFTYEYEKKETITFGVVDKKDVYKLIHEGKDINLNYCYIEDFSLLDFVLKYPNSPSIDKDKRVYMKNFTAVSSFFCSSSQSAIEFNSAYFVEGDVNFCSAKFGKGKVNFSLVDFGSKNVDFSYSNFGEGYLDFTVSKFGKGYVSFNSAKFEKSTVGFSGTYFGEASLSFTEAQANRSIFEFSSCIFKDNIDMRFEYCKKIVLRNCKIEKILDMKWSRYCQVKIDTLVLCNTDNLGQIKLDWKNNNVNKMIKSQKKETNHYEKSEQYRLLKENYRNQGHYDDEDRAYTKFKRYEMLSKLKGENIDNNLHRLMNIVWNGLFFIPKLILFDWIGGYGTRPFNVLVTMLVTIGAFAGIYYFFPDMIASRGQVIEVCKIVQYNAVEVAKIDIWTALYHSIMTFFTIGYGNISPLTKSGILISGFEGFCGMFLMSYFTVSFVRKLLR